MKTWVTEEEDYGLHTAAGQTGLGPPPNRGWAWSQTQFPLGIEVLRLVAEDVQFGSGERKF